MVFVAEVGFAPTNHLGLGYEPSEFDYFSTPQCKKKTYGYTLSGI